MIIALFSKHSKRHLSVSKDKCELCGESKPVTHIHKKRETRDGHITRWIVKVCADCYLDLRLWPQIADLNKKGLKMTIEIDPLRSELE